MICELHFDAMILLCDERIYEDELVTVLTSGHCPWCVHVAAMGVVCVPARCIACVGVVLAPSEVEPQRPLKTAPMWTVSESVVQQQQQIWLY
jgi:hypothetical protein